MSAASILQWLEDHATQILIQRLPAYRRAKNRCVVQFIDASGASRAIGGRTLLDAVTRAQLRAVLPRADNPGSMAAL